MRKHIEGLDGVRALAVSLVLLTHFWWYPQTAEIFNRVAAFGWVGVDLFFVLSGFLITGILRDSRSEPRHFRNFYARRALRILPLYYLLLALVLIVLPVVNDLPEQVMRDRWMYWLHMGNFAIAENGWQLFLLDVTWSLSLEEQFYLIWPALIFRLSNRKLMALCLSLIIAMPIARFMLWESLGWSWLHMVFRADSFAVGGLIAVAMREGIDVRRWKYAALMWAPILALVLTRNFSRDSMIVNTVGYSMNAIAAAGLLLIAMEARAFTWRPAAYVGKVSYGIYIYHPLCLMAASFAIGNVRSFPQLAAVIALTLIVASASFWVYERPILSLKRYFQEQQRGIDGTAPQSQSALG